MFARAVIERTDHYGAVVMALTDSMSANSTPEDAGDFQAMERGIVGKRVYMRVLPDGSSELIGTDGTINSIIRAFLADMPATLPSGPVEVGATWERVVNLPLQAGGRPHSVRTTFQLDSLSLGRRMAYISMRGLIVEAQTLPDSAARTTTSGNMKGNMTLDRQRGWIVASVATITIKAIVKRPIESALPPLNFQIRITQEMRTLNQR
jgi:hypothetical protein